MYQQAQEKEGVGGVEAAADSTQKSKQVVRLILHPYASSFCVISNFYPTNDALKLCIL